MATTRGVPEPEETREERVVRFSRSLIAGHEQGAMRRIVLYALTFALCVSPFPVAAVVPLTLLIATDPL